MGAALSDACIPGTCTSIARLPWYDRMLMACKQPTSAMLAEAINSVGPENVRPSLVEECFKLACSMNRLKVMTYLQETMPPVDPAVVAECLEYMCLMYSPPRDAIRYLAMSNIYNPLAFKVACKYAIERSDADVLDMLLSKQDNGAMTKAVLAWAGERFGPDNAMQTVIVKHFRLHRPAPSPTLHKLFSRACTDGSDEALIELLQLKNEAGDFMLHPGPKQLQEVCYKGHYKCVLVLLALTGDCAIDVSADNWLALRLAVLHRLTMVVKALMTIGRHPVDDGVVSNQSYHVQMELLYARDRAKAARDAAAARAGEQTARVAPARLPAADSVRGTKPRVCKRTGTSPAQASSDSTKGNTRDAGLWRGYVAGVQQRKTVRTRWPRGRRGARRILSVVNVNPVESRCPRLTDSERIATEGAAIESMVSAAIQKAPSLPQGPLRCIPPYCVYEAVDKASSMLLPPYRYWLNRVENYTRRQKAILRHRTAIEEMRRVHEHMAMLAECCPTDDTLKLSKRLRLSHRPCHAASICKLKDIARSYGCKNCMDVLQRQWRGAVPVSRRPSRRHLIAWRQALCAHRDASLLGRCCAEGRPLELGKRLRLGKLACSAGRLVELDAMAREGGHDDCMEVLPVSSRKSMNGGMQHD